MLNETTSLTLTHNELPWPSVLVHLFELDSLKKFLDFSHLRCPMAFVKCKQALLTLEAGQRLQVQLEDSASIHDILSWCQSQELECQKLCLEYGVILEFSRSGASS